MPMTDLFDGAPDPQVQVDPNKNYLEELVGEGKKFKSVEDLARGKAEADAHIARVQAEAEGLRTELRNRARLGDLVDQLANLPKNPPADPPAHPPTPDAGDSLDPAKVQQMLNDLLTQREQQSVTDRNLNTVKTELVKAFGPGYADILASKANSLGLTKEALNDLAAKSPQAFFTLVGVNPGASPAPSGFTPPASSHRTSGLPEGNVERNKAYYDKIKLTNPVLYWDSKTQNQLHRDAMRLQERFFT